MQEEVDMGLYSSAYHATSGHGHSLSNMTVLSRILTLHESETLSLFIQKPSQPLAPSPPSPSLSLPSPPTLPPSPSLSSRLTTCTDQSRPSLLPPPLNPAA